jgi:hypothetical protein
MTTTSNQYPFTTKAQVKSLIENGDAVQITAFAAVMQDRTDRRDADPTLKRCGWMSSHERRGREVGVAAQQAVATGEALSGETLALATQLCASYPKQIAAELRSRAIAADSALNEQAAVFGVAE